MSNSTYPKKIVVRSPNWIGDHILASAFYAGLRLSYPKSELTLMAPELIGSVPLPKSCFDRQILFIPAEKNTVHGMLRLARRIQAHHFDFAISLPASISSSLLFLLAGIPQRVGFFQSGSQIFYTSSLRWTGRQSGKHKADLYLELLDHIGGERPNETPAAKEDNSLRENLIVVAPGASIALREWPFYTEFILALRRGYPKHRIVTVGSPQDIKWSSMVRRQEISGIEDLIGKTTLVEVVDLCKRAQLVIANDSGLAHLSACLAKAPTLVLFGPGDPQYVKPVGQKTHFVRENLPCSPCESARCAAPHGYQRCLRDLSVHRVLSQACEMLK